MVEADVIDTLKPRAQQKLRTRGKILNAALKLFAESGFDATSIRDIASEAGVQHGLIKHHFDGKERLWKAAVDYLFERQVEEMKAPPGFSELPPERRFRDWLHRQVRYCSRHPEHARIMVQESMRDTERLRWAVEKHIKPVHEQAARDIEKFIKAGVLPKVQARSIIHIINAATQSPFMLSNEVALADGFDARNDAQIEAYADDLFTFLIMHCGRAAAS